MLDSPQLGNRQHLRKCINARPPDHYAGRKLPPLPPAVSGPSSQHSKDGDNLDRLVVSMEPKYGQCNRQNGMIENEGSVCIASGTSSSQVTLESCVENLIINGKGVESCQRNIDRIVLECNSLPQLKKLIFSKGNNASDCDLIRTEFQRMMSVFNPNSGDSNGHLNNDCIQLEEIKTDKAIETKVIVKGKNSESSSSDDSRNNRPEDQGTSSSPSRKNLSVRFAGSSPQPPKEKKNLDRRRRKRNKRKCRDQFNFRRDQDDSSSTCSTCSSSSSSDDPSVYELPPRRAYGGVRITYVPNDAVAVAKQRQQACQPRSQLTKQPSDKSCTIS